jgi:hypothetical protein
MNRLIDPPSIKVAVQRMSCSACGAEANASCTCGVPYVPKAMRAAVAIAADPTKSNRAIADEIGVSEPTVRRAREAGASHDAAATHIGRDGKSYPAAQPRANVAPDLIAEANKHLAKILPLIWQMTPRQRAMFRTAALQKMADAAGGKSAAFQNKVSGLQTPNNGVCNA